MTNKQLQDKFVEINLKHDNIFDKYLALQEIDKDYKTSDFYKATHKSVSSAFELYLQYVGKFDSILSILQDDEAITRLLNKVVEVFDMNNVLNTMDEDNKELFKQFLPYLKK